VQSSERFDEPASHFQPTDGGLWINQYPTNLHPQKDPQVVLKRFFGSERTQHFFQSRAHSLSQEQREDLNTSCTYLEETYQRYQETVARVAGLLGHQHEVYEIPEVSALLGNVDENICLNFAHFFGPDALRAVHRQAGIASHVIEQQIGGDNIQRCRHNMVSCLEAYWKCIDCTAELYRCGPEKIHEIVQAGHSLYRRKGGRKTNKFDIWMMECRNHPVMEGVGNNLGERSRRTAALKEQAENENTPSDGELGRLKRRVEQRTHEHESKRHMAEFDSQKEAKALIRYLTEKV
jgi:hypothetical protein